MHCMYMMQPNKKVKASHMRYQAADERHLEKLKNGHISATV